MKDILFTQLSTSDIRQLIGEEIRKALADFNPPDPGNHKRILNFEQACEYLTISKSHGYKLTSKGLIPHSKRGKRIYFQRQDLDAWLLANQVQTVSNLQEKMNDYLTKNQTK